MARHEIVTKVVLLHFLVVVVITKFIYFYLFFWHGSWPNNNRELTSRDLHLPESILNLQNWPFPTDSNYCICRLKFSANFILEIHRKSLDFDNQLLVFDFTYYYTLFLCYIIYSAFIVQLSTPNKLHFLFPYKLFSIKKIIDFIDQCFFMIIFFRDFPDLFIFGWRLSRQFFVASSHFFVFDECPEMFRTFGKNRSNFIVEAKMKKIF